MLFLLLFADYSNGYYTFSTNHLSVYALVENNLNGDANEDGIININDVTYLQMHIAGETNTDNSALIDESNVVIFDSVDMDKSGILDILDVTALQNIIANAE